MQCQLPNKKAIDNTRNFLTELGAIDSNYKIQDVPLFLDVVDQLSQDANRAYGVQGQLWEVNPLNNRFATPNETLLNQIDQIRKDQGLYEEQVAGSILDKVSIALPDNFTNYHLRVTSALLSDKIRQPELNNLQGFYNDLIKQGIPSQQIDLVKDILSDVEGKVTKEDIIRELLLKYTYGVEINVSLQTHQYIPNTTNSFRYNGWYYNKGYSYDIYGNNQQIFTKARIVDENLNPWDGPDFYDSDTETNISKEEYYSILEIAHPINTPTQYYSNLTVPGGTNGSYREVNIESPFITLPKSHAQFNTEHTLMFSRMDDVQTYSEKDIEKLISLMENNGQLKIKCN